MPNYDEHDPEIGSIWVRKVLLEDPAVRAIIGERAWDDIGVPKGPVYPFVYWTSTELSNQKDCNGVYRIDYKFDIRAVWKFDANLASRSPCRPLTKAMKKALTDNGFPHFELPNVGTVHQSTFESWYRPPFREDSTFRYVEHGVSIILVTSV